MDGLTIWTAILAGATVIMAGGIVYAAVIGINTLKENSKRNRYNYSNDFFNEFMKLILNDFEALSKKDYLRSTQDEYKCNRIISFFSKLGYFLKNKKIELSDLEITFHSYLFSNKEKMLILVDNLQKYYPVLSNDVKNNCNFLFNQISEYVPIHEFENLFRNFNVKYYAYPKGELIFKGSLSKIFKKILKISK